MKLCLACLNLAESLLTAVLVQLFLDHLATRHETRGDRLLVVLHHLHRTPFLLAL